MDGLILPQRKRKPFRRCLPAIGRASSADRSLTAVATVIETPLACRLQPEARAELSTLGFESVEEQRRRSARGATSISKYSKRRFHRRIAIQLRRAGRG